jgi:hypothetical protein
MAKIPATYAHLTNQFSGKKVAQTRGTFFLCHKILKEKIMTKKKIWLGMLALALVFGMTVVGCGDDGGGGGGGKSITITGISSGFEQAQIVLFSSMSENGMVAIGYKSISGTSVTIPLFTLSSEGELAGSWTGSGSYYLMLSLVNNTDETESMYIYTNGQTLAQLGLTTSSTQAQALAALPKFNVSADSSTIAFSKFITMPDW